MFPVIFTTMLPMFLDATNSFSNVTNLATELLNWLITSMGSILTFIRGNAEIMVWFIVAIVGLAVGMLIRIWRSVG